MLQISEEIYVTVIGVSLIVVILSIGIIIAIINYKRRQEIFLREKIQREEEFNKLLLQSQIEVQEATFADLGKELHDNIGQLLSTAKMLLGIAEMTLADKTPIPLITAEETVGTAIKELRSLSKSLNKEWLEQFNLIDNLTTEVSRINSANAVRLHLSAPEKLYFEVNKQLILFRIMQEAIQNAIKHAAAKNIDINISENNGTLAIEIKDDGVGFDVQKIAEGVGIINMKNRAKLLDGIIEWQSCNTGTLVLITIIEN